MSESTNVGTIDLSLILNDDKFKSNLNNITKYSETASNKISNSLKKVGAAVAVAFSVTKIVQFGKTCLEVATETSNAWVGLNSILTGQGKSFETAKNFINDYVSDGLVPLSNAVTAYKNLALRGYNTEQIESTLNALKNSATFARQSSYTLGEAVQTATEGLKNENSILVDNAGVTKNVAKMWEDYAKSIGKSTTSLTQEEKIQAEVNGILKETKFQSNDAAVYTQTYSGKVAQLTQSLTYMKEAIGNVTQPIAKIFIPVIQKAVDAVTNLFNSLKSLLAMFGYEADSVENISTAVSDALDSIESDVEDTVASINKTISGFDEIEKLGDDSSSSDSTSDSSIDTSDIIDTSSTTASAIESIFNSISFDGLVSAANNAFDKIKKIFASVKKSFQKIWDNGTMKKTLQLMIDLGEMFFNIVGDIAEAFDNVWNKAGLGDRVIQAIIDYFNAILELILAIGESFRNVWNNGTGETTLRLILEIVANTYEALKGWATAYKNAWVEGGKGEAIIQSIFNAVNNVLSIVNGVKEAINKWWNSENGEKYANAVVSIFKTLSGWAEKFTAGLKNIWENGGRHLFESLQEAWSNLVEIFDIVLQALDPIISTIIDFASNVLAGLLDTLGWLIDRLNDVANWMIEHQTTITVITDLVVAFFAAWEVAKVMAFIQQAGGLLTFFTTLTSNIWGTIAAKIADEAETVALTLLYAKDFVVSLASGTAALVTQAAQWVVNTALKVADTAATIAGTVATTAATAATWLFNAALAVLTSPITLVIAAIAALIAIIVVCVKNWDTIKETVVNVATAIKDTVVAVFNKLKEVVNTVITAIKEVICNVWNKIKETVVNVVTNIKDKVVGAFTSIKTSITNIFNSIKTTITNVWNTIWGTIKNVINSILGGIEGMVNGVIKGINLLIKALNLLSFDIPDWVPVLGGKKFGFNLKTLSEVSLPRLAEGAFLKANTPQLAIVGDNKTQGEVVAPEDKLISTTLEALKQFFKEYGDTFTSSNNEDSNINVNVYLDNELVQRIQQKRSNKLSLATNGRC